MTRADEVKSLIKLIEEFRAERNISKARMAKLLKVSPSAMYGWYSDKPILWPSSERLAIIWQNLQNLIDNGEDAMQYKLQNGTVEDLKTDPLIDVINSLVMQEDKLNRQLEISRLEIDELQRQRNDLLAKRDKISAAIETLRELEEID